MVQGLEWAAAGMGAQVASRLPQKQTLDALQNTWATVIEPVLALPPNQGILLKNIHLINGVTVINHLLQRTQQGYMITDQDAAATIYRSQPLNNLTLTLTSNASVNVSLWVY